MFELEYKEIDALMKIEHDMLSEGSQPGVTGGWNDHGNTVFGRKAYMILYRFSLKEGEAATRPYE